MLVRTVSIERRAGRPASRQRVETQILHFERRGLAALPYVWNDDQADAVLAEAGGRRGRSTVRRASWPRERSTGFTRERSAFSVITPGLRKGRPSSGSSRPRLSGSIRPVEQAVTLAEEPRSTNLPSFMNWDFWPGRPTLRSCRSWSIPYDESADLDRRARSYPQTNCAHCHQFNAGGSANIALGFESAAGSDQTVGIRPIQGTFKIAGAESSRPGTRRDRCCITASPSPGGGRMPESARTRSTSARPGCSTTGSHGADGGHPVKPPPRSHPRIARRSSRSDSPITSATRRSIGGHPGG